MTNYRNEARKYLRWAKAELASEDDHRLRYAALDLRFAIEALTYDRATAYEAELPPSEYETWQPRKLMTVLLKIDPQADKNSALAVGLEDTYGEPPAVTTPLGEEFVFNLALVKTHYDALASYLHVPSLKQAKDGPPSLAKLRHRCDEVVTFIEKAIASPIWNLTFGIFSKIQCQYCGAVVRKRIPHGEDKVSATCFECSATYTITDASDGKMEWHLEYEEVRCGNHSCDHVILIPKGKLGLGAAWECPACKGRNSLSLCVAFEGHAADGDKA